MIIDHLAAKHSEDFFQAEMRTGPSPCPIIDAWAMKKSWVNPLVIGYEIKTDRSDFLADNKWMQYLEFCNCLYFACPPKLISAAEIGPEVGLVWVYSPSGRIITKKKAPFRDKVNEDVFRYALMSRCSAPTGRLSSPSREERIIAWRRMKSRGKEIDWWVKGMIRARFRELEEKARVNIDGAKNCKELMAIVGVRSIWEVKEFLLRLKKLMDSREIATLDEFREVLDQYVPLLSRAEVARLKGTIETIQRIIKTYGEEQKRE